MLGRYIIATAAVSVGCITLLGVSNSISTHIPLRHVDQGKKGCCTGYGDTEKKVETQESVWCLNKSISTLILYSLHWIKQTYILDLLNAYRGNENTWHTLFYIERGLKPSNSKFIKLFHAWNLFTLQCFCFVSRRMTSKWLKGNER